MPASEENTRNAQPAGNMPAAPRKLRAGRSPRKDAVEDEAQRQHRRRQALELKRGGATLQQIVDLNIGYTHRGNVSKDIKAALDSITEQPAQEYVDFQIDRCEALIRALWPDRRKPNVALTIIAIMNREARYIGADAPTRQVVTVITEDIVDAEIKRLEQEIADRDNKTITVDATD